MTAIDAGDAPRGDITAHPKGLGLRRFKDASFVFWGVIATLIGLGTLVALVTTCLGAYSSR